MTSSWLDDPNVRLALEEQRVRRGILIQACIWMPLFIVSFAAFIFFFLDRSLGWDRGGTWFLVIVLAIFASLFGFQGIQAMLDLFGKPAEITGRVGRRWARSDSFVIRSHYIRIEKKIFRIDRVLHGDVQEGDHVRIRYYPHSAVVVHVEQVRTDSLDPVAGPN